jgi:hypothetical protein
MFIKTLSRYIDTLKFVNCRQERTYRVYVGLSIVIFPFHANENDYRIISEYWIFSVTQESLI